MNEPHNIERKRLNIKKYVLYYSIYIMYKTGNNQCKLLRIKIVVTLGAAGNDRNASLGH